LPQKSEHLADFTFDQINYEPAEPGDCLNVSVVVSPSFQELAISDANVNDAWHCDDETRDPYTSVCHFVEL
jgi:hypothetical protein